MIRESVRNIVMVEEGERICEARTNGEIHSGIEWVQYFI